MDQPDGLGTAENQGWQATQQKSLLMHLLFDCATASRSTGWPVTRDHASRRRTCFNNNQWRHRSRESY